jgi:hypothetical protein
MSFHGSTTRKLATVAVASVAALTVGAGLASVAGATVPHAKLPLITSFKASPNSLPDKGGTVKVTADVKFATTCTLSVSPGIKGLPENNFACTASSFTKSFSIAKDTSAVARTYTFHLSAKNSEGSATAPTALVAEGGAPPPISFGIGGENFGTVGVSIHSTDVEVQVTNNSKLPQSLGEFGMIGTDSSDFNVPSNDCAGIVLSPDGGECSFAVDFIPTGTGKRVATLELSDLSWGPSGTDAVLPLWGTGVFSEISISASSQFYSGGDINFGTQGVDTTTNPFYITVSDSSPTVPLYVNSIGVSGQNFSDFGVSPGNCGANVIDPGASCQFTVNFTPTASGLRKAQVDVYGNMSGGVWTIPESGTGEYATLTLDSPPGTPISAINFGDTAGPASVEVTVTNTSSNVFLAFGSLTVVGGQNAVDFSWSPQSCAYAGAELAPAQSCTFAVNFLPQLPSVEYFGTFSLFDNVASASQTLDLSGDETTPPS